MIAPQTLDRHNASHCVVAIVESESKNASLSDFWKNQARTNPQQRAVTESSVFASKMLFLANGKMLHFKQLEEKALGSTSLQEGWDGYDAPPPNKIAVRAILYLLNSMKQTSLSPSSVLASADGGLGISFRGRNTRRAAIEVLNSGTASYLLYGKGLPTLGEEFELSSDVDSSFVKIEEYL